MLTEREREGERWGERGDLYREGQGDETLLHLSRAAQLDLNYMLAAHDAADEQ